MYSAPFNVLLCSSRCRGKLLEAHDQSSWYFCLIKEQIFHWVVKKFFQPNFGSDNSFHNKQLFHLTSCCFLAPFTWPPHPQQTFPSPPSGGSNLIYGAGFSLDRCSAVQWLKRSRQMFFVRLGDHKVAWERRPPPHPPIFFIREQIGPLFIGGRPFSEILLGGGVGWGNDLSAVGGGGREKCHQWIKSA